MVGNGSILDCQQLSPATKLLIQDHTFTVTLRVLLLSGADIVLGVEWLRTLGPIITDYYAFTMHFSHQGHSITLSAGVQSDTDPVSANQVRRMLHTQSTSALFHLSLLPANPIEPPPDPPHPISTINELLLHFSSLFLQPSSLPPPRQHDHHINLLPSANPINVRPYRYPHFQKTKIEKQVTALLESSFIQPSRSPFSSPVLLVKKKDETWRMCMDYRALNSITVRDRFPLPTIDELLDELGRASWFSKIDLRQGFHQILMAPEDISKTAFRTHHGHYEYRVMPFGLCNAPSTFLAAMNAVLGPHLRKFATVFFDDILIYSETLPDHLLHLERVFASLTQAQYYLKRSKCLFGLRKLDYLGHVVSEKGVQPDPSKIQAILDMPAPRSAKELRSFLGLTGFYRKFVKDYAAIATPLTRLLCKDAFQWLPESQEAFLMLKRAMMAALVLALPDFSLPFALEIDVSGTAMGAVLQQQRHPIAFFSKPFCPRMQQASTSGTNTCSAISLLSSPTTAASMTLCLRSFKPRNSSFIWQSFSGSITTSNTKLDHPISWQILSHVLITPVKPNASSSPCLTTNSSLS